MSSDANKTHASTFEVDRDSNVCQTQGETRRDADPTSDMLEVQTVLKRLFGDDHKNRGLFVARLYAQECAMTNSGSVNETAPAADVNKIGPFGIKRLLGKGSTGNVFLAERLDDTGMRVALKVLRDEMSSPTTLARFRRERQILAALDHSNIAKLYDSGMAAGQRPFFAMEYVQGEPIDDYCARHRLSIRARLRLFLHVCDAVEYAHNHQVLHRDLKPANILVDARGIPKLLDFGVAAFLDKTKAKDPTITQHGAGPLTPNYASPEQIRGKGLSPASDLYSLGVVLFQLLTQRLPYRLHSNSISELFNAILRRDPISPSQALIDHVQLTAGDGIDNRRRIFREMRQLQGDVDAILLKALAKNPAERYGGVAELAEDIQRHLDGLPIEAKRQTWGYRFRKFVSRFRAPIMVAGVVILMTTLFSFAVIHKHREVVKEREINAHIVEFMTRLFEVSDLNYKKDGFVSAKMLLDRGRRRIESELNQKHDLRGRLQLVMGRVYINMRLFDQAEHLLEESYSQRRMISNNDIWLIEHLHEMARLHNFRAEYLKARKTAERALEQAKSLPLKSTKQLRIRLLNQLGLAMWSQGEVAESEAVFQEVLQLCDSRDLEPHLYHQALNNLATIAWTGGDLNKAQNLFQQALSGFRQIHGDHHASVATVLNNLSSIHMERGAPREAKIFLVESIQINRGLSPEGDEKLAASLTNLAQLTYFSGDYEQALLLLREAYQMTTRIFDHDHPSATVVKSMIGLVLQQKGDWAAAEKELRATLFNQRKILAEDHDYLLQTRLRLVANLLAQSSYHEAGRHLEFVKRAHLNKKKIKPNLRAQMLVWRAVLAAHFSETDVAETSFQNAVETLDGLGVSAILLKLEARCEYGKFLAAQQRFEESEHQLNLSLSELKSVFPSGHVGALRIQRLLAAIFLEQGRKQEAKHVLNKAFSYLETVDYVPAREKDLLSTALTYSMNDKQAP